MPTDLRGAREASSERCAPDQDAGRLIEVQRLARYRWAAAAARGGRVLDAGCGAGDGCRLLASGGAVAVTGVDRDSSSLEAVASSMPDVVTLQAGDLDALALDDDSFDLITCFEVIEHVGDPRSVLDELVRVLAPGGLLLLSAPGSGAGPADDAHRPGPFGPGELQVALEERFSHVRLVRQSAYIVSALLGDAALAVTGGDPVTGVALHKLIASSPDTETFTIALASATELPELGELALMTGTLELQAWRSEFENQSRAIEDRDVQIADLQARLAETAELAGRLVDAEQALAVIPDLRLRIDDLERALDAARESAHEDVERISELDRRLMDSERVLVEVMGSPSWRITKPLRTVKRILTR